MKLCSIVVCVSSAFLVQMCTSVDVSTYGDSIQTNMNQIDGASEQFKADVNAIYEKNKENFFFLLMLDEFMKTLAFRMYGHVLKINVDTVKEYSKQEAEYRIIDNANIMQSVLSKQLPLERIGGFVNLFAATRPSAPNDEIQKALDYLYGSKNDTLPNVPALDSVTCSANEETVITAEQTASVVEKLKSVVELDPKVIKDVNTVAEKFPCHDFVYGILLTLINQLTDELNGTTRKVNACAIKANTQLKLENETNVLIGINSVEKILATRLPTESFNDLFNALKTLNRSNASDDDVKKALEYLYGPKEIDGLLTKC